MVSVWCSLGLTFWKALPGEGVPRPIEEEGGEERGGTRGTNPVPASAWEGEVEASKVRFDQENPPR